LRLALPRAGMRRGGGPGVHTHTEEGPGAPRGARAARDRAPGPPATERLVAMQVSTAEFKKGLRIVHDGNPYTIVDFQHVKPGKVIDNTFRSGEKVELVDFEEKHMQFLYRDDRYNFMDTETYEQVSLSADEVGEAREYLKENTEVDVLYIAGAPAGIELPNFVELAIAHTDPGVRGDTAQGGTKPATLETGVVVQVPLFLSEGDVVKVDTRTGDYLGRVAVAG